MFMSSQIVFSKFLYFSFRFRLRTLDSSYATTLSLVPWSHAYVMSMCFQLTYMLSCLNFFGFMTSFFLISWSSLSYSNFFGSMTSCLCHGTHFLVFPMLLENYVFSISSENIHIFILLRKMEVRTFFSSLKKKKRGSLEGNNILLHCLITIIFLLILLCIRILNSGVSPIGKTLMYSELWKSTTKDKSDISNMWRKEDPSFTANVFLLKTN